MQAHLYMHVRKYKMMNKLWSIRLYNERNAQTSKAHSSSSTMRRVVNQDCPSPKDSDHVSCFADRWLIRSGSASPSAVETAGALAWQTDWQTDRQTDRQTTQTNTSSFFRPPTYTYATQPLCTFKLMYAAFPLRKAENENETIYTSPQHACRRKYLICTYTAGAYTQISPIHMTIIGLAAPL